MAANIICTGDTTILRVIDFKQTKLEFMLAMSHTENPDNFSYDQFTIITPCGTHFVTINSGTLIKIKLGYSNWDFINFFQRAHFNIFYYFWG